MIVVYMDTSENPANTLIQTRLKLAGIEYRIEYLTKEQQTMFGMRDLPMIQVDDKKLTLLEALDYINNY